MSKMFDDWRRNSPYYDESHEALSDSLRRFIAREAIPHVETWEQQRMVPREFHRKAADAGILGLGFAEEYGGTLEGVNTFHQLVKIEELAGAGAGGVMSGLLTHAVALPPLIAMGSENVRQRIVPAILRGEKIMAIAVTEPSGGSDVAAIQTRAVRQGDEYIVSGSKTFISNGMRADVFLVAVRTSEADKSGISILLIEAPTPGFERTQLDKMGWHCSDTSTLYFDNVRVPVENLIGPEHDGLRHVLNNFNSERLGAAQQALAYSRLCLEEAGLWAGERETFGKKLGQHPIIRSKLADMVRHINTTQAWIDLCAWQFDRGTVSAADIALLKVQATRTFEWVAREASQVLGGASYITGSRIERLYREVRVLAIGGGSEEILLDLAGRQMGFGAGFGIEDTRVRASL
jgi:acyl-CoA dehydrogenase